MRLLRNCNSKHPLWLLHSHSLLDHTGMNNPLIYFFTVMHLPYAFISFLTQTEFQGQTFQSLSCIYPHLPHPSFVDWTSTLVKFVSAANVQALFLILSPQTVFKHLVSILLFLWVPYLVTTQLLFRCSALASSTNSTHGPILHSLPFVSPDSFPSPALWPLSPLLFVFSPFSAHPPLSNRGGRAWNKQTSSGYSI